MGLFYTYIWYNMGCPLPAHISAAQVTLSAVAPPSFAVPQLLRWLRASASSLAWQHAKASRGLPLQSFSRIG